MHTNLPQTGGASELEREGSGTPGATAAYESLKDAAPAEAVGSVIAGKYKLLQEIGEGGMGSVFMADQTHPVKRRVAVKVIKAGMDSARVLARFEAERQALALMDHPHIAKVLDAGTTETGRPFFVMELVKGIPLTQFCDEHKLPVLDRLNLFMQVCSAVQHAHQKGIIHRDLKPTNILVESHDGKPVPKVIDFGLAKATSGMQLTEHSLFTALGQVLGTPLYMAPEQAAFNAIDVDTRADVYALGVILYELLTGTTPIERESFKQAAFDEMLRVIREQEPPTPSSRISSSELRASVAAVRQIEPVKLGRFVRGELDWIVMKSLSKERDRRYDSATAFARDVERFLNHEPVQAGPPSAAYKLRKFVRRNRPQVIAAAVVLLALIAGMAGTTFGLIRAQRARTAETKQRTIAEQKQQEAEASAKSEAEQRAIAEQREREATEAERLAVQREQEAKKARDETKQVLDYLVASFRKSDPDADGEKLTVAELFGQAVEQLETTFPNQPLIQAQLLHAIGHTYFGLGLYQKSVAVFERARDLRRSELGEGEHDTLLTMGSLGMAYRAAGRRAEALPLLEQTLELMKAKLGPQHLDTIGSMDNLATAYQTAGRLEEAVRLHEQTLELAKAKLGPEHPNTLKAMNNLAVVYQDTGRLAEALTLKERTLELIKAKLGPEHPNTLVSMSSLAAAYWEAGRIAEGLPLLERALELQKAKLGPEHPVTLNSMNNLAGLYRAAGRLAEALPLLEQTLELKKSKLGPEHPSTLLAMSNLAAAYQSTGRLAEAIPLHEQTLEVRKAQLGLEHPDTLTSMNNLAAAYFTAGKVAEALPLFEQTLELIKAKLGPEHPNTLTLMGSLAKVYLANEQPETALPLLDRSIAGLRRRAKPDDPTFAGLLAAVSLDLLKHRQYPAAETYLRECLTIREKKLPDDWLLFSTKSMLGGALAGQKKFQEAEPLLVEGYSGMKDREAKIPPAAKTRLPEAIRRLVDLYTAWDRPEEAAKWRAILEETARNVEGTPAR